MERGGLVELCRHAVGRTDGRFRLRRSFVRSFVRLYVGGIPSSTSLDAHPASRTASRLVKQDDRRQVEERKEVKKETKIGERQSETDGIPHPRFKCTVTFRPSFHCIPGCLKDSGGERVYVCISQRLSQRSQSRQEKAGNSKRFREFGPSYSKDSFDFAD